MRALVLGNGKSRQGINLESLRGYGVVFGCNAIHRDFTPNYLIAVDKAMIREIIDSGYAKDNDCIFLRARTFLPASVLSQSKIRDVHQPGFASGPLATWMACSMGARQVYLLGMDLSGDTSNNMYFRTPNYAIYEKKVDIDNWVDQFGKIFVEFSQVSFYKIDGTFPDKWDYKNVFHIGRKEFKERMAA